MKTDPKMNEKIVAMLRLHDNPAVLYAAQRIEELEQELHEAREAAQTQSETVQCDWLSPAEAEGLQRQLEAVRQAQKETREALTVARAHIRDLETSLAYCNADCET